MKKTILAWVLVMSMILILCAACGGSKTGPTVEVSATMAPNATPEPVEETAEPEETEAPVEETAEPEESAEPEATDAPEATNAPAQQGTNSNANQGTNSGGNSSAANPTPAPTEPPAEDKMDVAMRYLNSDVNALIAAIGQPNSSSYTASCLVIGGQDGFLYYDGFTVETIRRADGTETVYDIF